MQRLTLVSLAIVAALAIAACSPATSPAASSAASAAASPAASAAASPAASAASAEEITVTIQNNTLPTVSAKVDQRIRWENADTVGHTVTLDDGTRSGNVGPGGEFISVFSSPGTFTYHCDIHPTMTGSITITD